MTEKDQADKGWDTYQERVVRNETKGLGFEELVREVRESDRRLIEQRSDSLAKELAHRAEEVERLTLARRQADLHEFRSARKADQKALELQRKEYKRRLKALNGEYKRINDIQVKSVSRELFDAEKLRTDEARKALAKTSDDRLTVLNAQIDELKRAVLTESGAKLGRNDLIILVFGAVAAIAGVIVIANLLTGRP